MRDISREGKVAFWSATAGVGCALAFTIWILTASVYSSGQTILEANEETSVRLAIALPLVVALVLWTVLHLACRRNSRVLRGVGRAMAWVLLAFAVVTGFSIGAFVLPVAVAFLVSALMTPVDNRSVA